MIPVLTIDVKEQWQNASEKRERKATRVGKTNRNHKSGVNNVGER